MRCGPAPMPAGVARRGRLYALVAGNLASRTATVNVAPSADVSGTTTVTFTNRLVTGTVEVCKQVEAGSGLGGAFTFTIARRDGLRLDADGPGRGMQQPDRGASRNGDDQSRVMRLPTSPRSRRFRPAGEAPANSGAS